jgi:hypothetical protein
MTSLTMNPKTLYTIISRSPIPTSCVERIEIERKTKRRTPCFIVIFAVESILSFSDVVPLTLRKFRERIEEQPTLFDKDDWGSCGCFMGDEESK